MFGYVKPHIPDLYVKEYSFYKQIYCGLCRQLKKISRIMPFTLSYDFVYLALCRACVKNDNISFGKCSCAAKPFGTCAFAKADSLEFCAKASVILSAYKIYDDYSDSKGVKRLYYRMLYNKMKRILKKPAFDDTRELENIIRDRLSALSAVEKAHSESVYDGAEIFGELLSAVFAFGLCGDAQSIMKSIGYSTGRYIYILDAYADIKEDLRSGAYNPFIESLEPTYTKEFKEQISNILNIELMRSEASVNALENLEFCTECVPDRKRCANQNLHPDKGIVSIIKNIFYLGMPNTAKNVISCGKKPKEKKELSYDRSI